MAERVEEQEQGKSAYFLSYTPNSSELLAVCSLTSISHGPFQACFMGCSVAIVHEGKGVMKELCSYVINYAFSEVGLNRVNTGVSPALPTKHCIVPGTPRSPNYLFPVRAISQFVLKEDSAHTSGGRRFAYLFFVMEYEMRSI